MTEREGGCLQREASEAPVVQKMSAIRLAVTGEMIAEHPRIIRQPEPGRK
jgi:hypothetical protein